MNESLQLTENKKNVERHMCFSIRHSQLAHFFLDECEMQWNDNDAQAKRTQEHIFYFILSNQFS